MSSLLVINIWKCCFPVRAVQQPEEDQPQPEDPVGCPWLEPGIYSLHQDGGTAESHQDFADHSVTFLKSNSFEART